MAIKESTYDRKWFKTEGRSPDYRAMRYWRYNFGVGKYLKEKNWILRSKGMIPILCFMRSGRTK
jgi:hypothetical protein